MTNTTTHESTTVEPGRILCDGCGNTYKGEQGIRSHGLHPRKEGTDCEAFANRYVANSRAEASANLDQAPLEDSVDLQPQDASSDESEAAPVDDDLAHALAVLAGQQDADETGSSVTVEPVAQPDAPEGEVAAPAATEAPKAAAKGPKPIQRMTVNVTFDINMEQYAQVQGIRGWSPVRADLVEYVSNLVNGSRAKTMGAIQTATTK